MYSNRNLEGNAWSRGSMPLPEGTGHEIPGGGGGVGGGVLGGDGGATGVPPLRRLTSEIDAQAAAITTTTIPATAV